MNTATNAPTKAAKIWRRTRVGSLIAGALALVLWSASAFDSSIPVLALSLLILAASIWEVAWMGRLARGDLLWMLGGAAANVALFTFLVLDFDGESSVDGMARGWLLIASAVAAVSLVVAYALARVDSWSVKLAALAWLPLLLVSISYGTLEPAPYVAFTFLAFVALRLFVFGSTRAAALAFVGLGTVLLVSLPALAVVWRLFDHWGLVALIVICKLGDTAGYYVGSTLGKHHPFPSISPGKTSEGCFGSLVVGALSGAGAVALGWLPSEPWGLAGGLLGGALVNLAAQAGDLLESWVKRRAGVKDSGTWFGPSGGILDLVDSFLLAAPAALLGWPIVFTFADL